jgi:hypothetical protein
MGTLAGSPGYRDYWMELEAARTADPGRAAIQAPADPFEVDAKVREPNRPGARQPDRPTYD